MKYQCPNNTTEVHQDQEDALPGEGIIPFGIFPICGKTEAILTCNNQTSRLLQGKHLSVTSFCPTELHCCTLILKHWFGHSRAVECVCVRLCYGVVRFGISTILSTISGIGGIPRLWQKLVKMLCSIKGVLHQRRYSQLYSTCT